MLRPRSRIDAISRGILIGKAILPIYNPPFSEAVKPLLAGFFTNTPSWTFGLPTERLPGWVFGASRVEAVLVMGGISGGALGAVQGANIFASWAGAIGDPIRDPVADIFPEAARSILASIANAGIGMPPNILVGGLSFGGMIANVIAAEFTRITHQGLLWEVHTFGAGKSGGRTQATETDQNCTMYRWFSDTDPFTVNPPDASRAPLIVPIAGVYGAMRFANFVHPSGGLAFDASGGTRVIAESSISNPGYTLAMGSFLAGLDSDELNSHWLANLLARMELAAPLGASARRLRVADRERVRELRPQRALVGNRSYASKVRALAEKRLIMGQTVPQKVRFYVAMDNGIWKVLFQGAAVSWHGHKKGARAMARLLNASMASLIRAAVVDAKQVQTAIGTIIADAMPPNAAFVPNLNTIPPS